MTLTLRHSLPLYSLMEKGKQYSVKQLARLAGVSVRTLHLYDELGLLKPAVRTQARYRLYGEPELLRLQQILFYKDLGLPLNEIGEILDDPDFDLVKALEQHRKTLQEQRKRIRTLLDTIDKTIQHLKGGTMLTHEELYEGLPKEKAEAWRNEAKEKYGDEQVERSENALKKLGKPGFEKLKKEWAETWEQLREWKKEDPASVKVQEVIARHYMVTRKFWGTEHLPNKQYEAYKGLGQLYVNDERYTVLDGKPDKEFALFMQKAMAHFADGMK